MNFLLDTNIVSQRIKPNPQPKVMVWLQQLRLEQAFLSVVTIQESRTGLELLPPGIKRRNLEAWFESDVLGAYAGRILPITEEIADICGRLIAVKRREGKTPEINDMLMAATARVHGLSIATLNNSHFEKLGVELVKF